MRWEEPTGLPFIGLAAGGWLAIGLVMITVTIAALTGSTWWLTLYAWTAGYYFGWCSIVIIASVRRDAPEMPFSSHHVPPPCRHRRQR